MTHSSFKLALTIAGALALAPLAITPAAADSRGGYRDHNHRPPMRVEHRPPMPRGGHYRWRSGSWGWRNGAWGWTPGIYIRF
jgi:hypothetical protein